VQGGKGPHGEAHHMGGAEVQAGEDGGDVVGGAVLGIGARVGGHVRGRVAAGVVGDAAVAAREVADLRLPAAGVAGELMDEDDGGAGAGLDIVQRDTIIRHDMGHGLLLRLPARMRRG